MLKTHLLASTGGPAAKEGVTACGEPIFKSAHGSPLPHEWESRRRIGACYAVAEREFYLSPKGYCARCVKVWEQG